MEWKAMRMSTDVVDDTLGTTSQHFQTPFRGVSCQHESDLQGISFTLGFSSIFYY